MTSHTYHTSSLASQTGMRVCWMNEYVYDEPVEGGEVGPGNGY